MPPRIYTVIVVYIRGGAKLRWAKPRTFFRTSYARGGSRSLCLSRKYTLFLCIFVGARGRSLPTIHRGVYLGGRGGIVKSRLVYWYPYPSLRRKGCIFGGGQILRGDSNAKASFELAAISYPTTWAKPTPLFYFLIK